MCFLWLDQSIIIHKEKPWINNSYITSCVPCAFPLKKNIYIIKSENEIKEDSLKTVAMDELVVRSYRIVVAITRVSGGGILGSDCWNLGWEVGWFLHPFSCKGRFTLLTSQKGRVTLISSSYKSGVWSPWEKRKWCLLSMSHTHKHSKGLYSDSLKIIFWQYEILSFYLSALYWK